jgi:hypothetical protein
MGPRQKMNQPPVVGGNGIGELKKIEDELIQYSWKAIQEFERIFAPELYYDPATKTWDGWSQNIIPKEGKEQITNITLTYKGGYKDFWFRWNRFKNLLVFI